MDVPLYSQAGPMVPDGHTQRPVVVLHVPPLLHTTPVHADSGSLTVMRPPLRA
jgi:hypothetical protein